MTRTSAFALSLRTIEESTAAQEPGSSPLTWKESVGAADTSAAKKRLTRKRIPDSDSHIVEIRAARIVLVSEIRSTQQIHRENHRRTRVFEFEFHAGTGLNVIRPILAEQVHRRVRVPIQL